MKPHENTPDEESTIPRFRLTAQAQSDTDAVLEMSAREFGVDAKARYERLIIEAIRLLTENPLAIDTKQQESVSSGARSFHLSGARNLVWPPKMRVGKPLHFLLYRVEPGVVAIGRILHESMLAELHVSDATWD